MSVVAGFNSHPSEAKIIGGIVAGYGELVFALTWCVSQINGDFDSTFKAIYRVRGETNRIDIADALARSFLSPSAIRTLFEETIAAMRWCLKIRNQYAHCNWINTGSGLLFVNLEEVAREDAVIELGTLTQHHAELSLLKKQLTYFEWVDHCLSYLNIDAQVRAGKLRRNHLSKPTKLRRPELNAPTPDFEPLLTPKKRR